MNVVVQKSYSDLSHHIAALLEEETLSPLTTTVILGGSSMCASSTAELSFFVDLELSAYASMS